MASFSDLPAELVEDIVSHLGQSDLYICFRLNRALHTLVKPYLFRHIDLYVPPSNKVPRIDRFCLSIINDCQLAGRVESIRLGLRPDEDVKQDGQRWLLQDRSFDDGLLFTKAMNAMSDETLVAAGDHLRDAVVMRDYSAYSALLLLLLPSLQHLEIADHKGASLDHLHSILRNLNPGPSWNSRFASETLVARLSSIKQISLNIDRISGLAYPKDHCGPTLDHLLNLPGITKLAVSIPDGHDRDIRNRIGGFPLSRDRLVSKIRSTTISTLVIKHSGPLHILTSLLSCTPRLESLTYEMFYDSNEGESREPYLINLAVWNDALLPIKDTLKILVFSAEYCNTDLYSFKQPRIGDKLHGHLDLTYFEQLHTLQVPFPLLTGDAEFSITTEIYPLFPPNLRHLSLRPDLSHAQFPFPFDASILPGALPFHESKDEAQYLMNARMDASYMFQATLTILDYAPNLETIAVWQPADPSLSWFDGQIVEFATTCRNKGVTGKIVHPMILHWKKAQHWDLIREITVFDRLRPGQEREDRLFREEWEGVPLGLASQFHLHALRAHQVRLRR